MNITNNLQKPRFPGVAHLSFLGARQMTETQRQEIRQRSLDQIRGTASYKFTNNEPSKRRQKQVDPYLDAMDIWSNEAGEVAALKRWGNEKTPEWALKWRQDK
jgi:hypothetical protein